MVKITEIADGLNNGILKNIDLVENNSGLNSNSGSKLEIVLMNPHSTPKSDFDSHVTYNDNNGLSISLKENKTSLIIKNCKFDRLELLSQYPIQLQKCTINTLIATPASSITITDECFINEMKIESKDLLNSKDTKNIQKTCICTIHKSTINSLSIFCYIKNFDNISLNIGKSKVDEINIEQTETHCSISDTNVSDIKYYKIDTSKLKLSVINSVKNEEAEEDYRIGKLQFQNCFDSDNINTDDLIISDVSALEIIQSSFNRVINLRYTKPEDTTNFILKDTFFKENAGIDFYMPKARGVSCNLSINNSHIEAKKFNIKNIVFNSIEIVNSMFQNAGKFCRNDFSKTNFTLTDSSFIGTDFTNNEWGKIDKTRFIGDRDTFRSMKNNFNSIGNKIESNAFHALELECALSEINISKNDKFILYMNKIISNFSQSWMKPIGWYIYLLILFTPMYNSNILSILKAFGCVILCNVTPIVYEKWISRKTKQPSTIPRLFIFIFVSLHIIFFNILANTSFSLVNIIYFIIPGLTIGKLLPSINSHISPVIVSNIFLLFLCQLAQIFIVYQLQASLRKNTRT